MSPAIRGSRNMIGAWWLTKKLLLEQTKPNKLSGYGHGVACAFLREQSPLSVTNGLTRRLS